MPKALGSSFYKKISIFAGYKTRATKQQYSMATPSKVSNDRKEKFFSSLNLAEATMRNYRTAFNSKFLIEYITENYKQKTLFDITDLDDLYNIYVFVRQHPKNEETHRVCSAAVMKYIRFLNDGKKIGRRIDYKKPRPCMRKPRKAANESCEKNNI